MFDSASVNSISSMPAGRSLGGCFHSNDKGVQGVSFNACSSLETAVETLAWAVCSGGRLGAFCVLPLATANFGVSGSKIERNRVRSSAFMPD